MLIYIEPKQKLKEAVLSLDKDAKVREYKYFFVISSDKLSAFYSKLQGGLLVYAYPDIDNGVVIPIDDIQAIYGIR